jgi:hypothetical protein
MNKLRVSNLIGIRAFRHALDAKHHLSGVWCCTAARHVHLTPTILRCLGMDGSQVAVTLRLLAILRRPLPVSDCPPVRLAGAGW